MTALPPDYDSDPERWRSWRPARDVHDRVASELMGPVLDIGCGEGRLADRLPAGVRWVGVDASIAQLTANTHRPVVQADMGALPFRDGCFAEATHLWCLYHVEEPSIAIAEARRVLHTAGSYFACTSGRGNDPELVPEGYPPTSFDAEEAVEIVRQVFERAEEERWDGPLVILQDREEIRAYCRHHHLPMDKADRADPPLVLTKRGVLIRAHPAERSIGAGCIGGP